MIEKMDKSEKEKERFEAQNMKLREDLMTLQTNHTNLEVKLEV
jgi:hypothetical protein